jgi:hypothetical protein
VIEQPKEENMSSGQLSNSIELWKAIHGGCWPGPPIDQHFSKLVNDVVAGLALHNLSSTFSDQGVAKQAKHLAAESLQRSLAALQKQLQVG